MNQPRLFAEPPAPPAEAKHANPSSRPLKYKGQSRAHDIANREAAIIILSDPVSYDGLPLEWAQITMERYR